MAHGSKCALNRVGGSDVLPMFGWEIIEREQHVTVFDQLGHRFFVFHPVGPHEKVERGVGISFGFRLPDVMQMAFGSGLH